MFYGRKSFEPNFAFSFSYCSLRIGVGHEVLHRIREILWMFGHLPLPLYLCSNTVKIHSASIEKGKSEEREGSNECCMKELCPYVSLAAPGKLQCALLLVLAVCWVSVDPQPATDREGPRAEGEERKAQGGKDDHVPFPGAPVQTGLHDAAASCSFPVVGKLLH